MSPKLINSLRDFFSTEPVEKAWIFGSYARGEETSESDIDILVRYSKDTCLGLFGIAELIEKLESLLGKKVDLVEEQTLYPRVAKIVNSEKIQVYERNA
ncbi:MAG: nucleotidyltransferase family protein [Muribaculaceae bacterium]|nr:nucleotidyltransferase family protein [Muribaculaceae bacterium]MDE6632984.1 nucleotidyltransferase family protein [Muribaculaceae bacterium]